MELIGTKVDRDLGQKNIALLLLQYSIPAIIATVATSVYNVVDRIFIGQMVGALALSGLTIALPLMNILSAFGTLVGSGAASIISIRMGETRHKTVEATLANSLILNLLIGAVLAAIGLVWLDEILNVFGASEITLPYARNFMRIILLGTPITQLFFSLNTIMRASGYPSKSMITVLLSMFVNLLLVLVLIYHLKLGIEGAALATVGGQAVGLVWELWHFINRKSHLNFKLGAFRLKWSIVQHILRIGTSPFCVHLCTCLVVLVMNWQLKNYGGDYAIGAYGIISTVVNFVIVIVLGLAQGMQPIVGYNYGANCSQRVLHTLILTITVGTAITSIGFLIMRYFALQISLAFTTDIAMSLIASGGMKIYTLMFPLIGFQVVATNFFQSIGKPHLSIFLSLSRQVLFLIPLVVIFPHFFELQGIWYAVPVADTLATIVTAGLLIYYYVKRNLGMKQI